MVAGYVVLFGILNIAFLKTEGSVLIIQRRVNFDEHSFRELKAQVPHDSVTFSVSADTITMVEYNLIPFTEQLSHIRGEFGFLLLGESVTSCRDPYMDDHFLLTRPITMPTTKPAIKFATFAIVSIMNPL